MYVVARWHWRRQLPSVTPFSSFLSIARVNCALAVMATAAFDNWFCSHDHDTTFQRRTRQVTASEEQCVLMNFALFLSVDAVVSGSISFKNILLFYFPQKMLDENKAQTCITFLVSFVSMLHVTCRMWFQKNQLFPEDFVRTEEQKRCW